MVDRDTEGSTRVTGLVERVELVTHVIQGWLEQLFDRRYGPGWHVRSLRRPYQAAVEHLAPAWLPDGLESPPNDQQRRCVEDGAVGAGDDSDQERQREALDRLATRDEDRRQDEHHGEAGDDRPRRGLHDAQVHDLLEGEALADTQVFADPVEDHDRVVDRETDDGQHGGHEERVDLPDAQVEHLAKDGKDAREDENVMQQGRQGRAAELKSRCRARSAWWPSRRWRG